MNFTAEEIKLLLNLLSGELVVERCSGYSDDPKIGALQAKLSIMLEVARRAERR